MEIPSFARQSHWPAAWWPILLVAVLVVWPATLRAAPDPSRDGDRQFHVAPGGNDGGDGSEGRPFATLERAQAAVRATLRISGRQRPITVFVHGGRYELEDTWHFGPDDSGTVDAPVIYTAWPGERPVISGGRRIESWEQRNGNQWAALLPDVRSRKWVSRQLFIDGERRPRARWPNHGFLRTDGPPRFGKQDRAAIERHFGTRVGFTHLGRMGKFGFRYRKGDVQRWTNLQDIALHVMHAWTSAVHWIANLDESRRTIRFTGPCRFPCSRFEEQMPYYVENFPEALDVPGEWYVDRGTGVLTYIARPGEDPRQCLTVVSRLKTLVSLEGNARAGAFVEGLVFRGLSFAHADWGPLDRAHENDGFGSVHFLDAAIMATGCRHCTFDRCRISRCGGYGIYLIDGSSHNRIERCELEDLGGGGILIGSRWSPYDTFGRELPPDDAPESWLCAYNTIDNNLIHHAGRVFRGVLGVFVAHAPPQPDYTQRGLRHALQRHVHRATTGPQVQPRPPQRGGLQPHSPPWRRCDE